MKKSDYPRREYHTDDVDNIPCDGCILLPICISTISPHKGECYCYAVSVKRIIHKSFDCEQLSDFITYDLLYGQLEVMDRTHKCEVQIHKVIRWLTMRKTRIRYEKRQK